MSLSDRSSMVKDTGAMTLRKLTLGKILLQQLNPHALKALACFTRRCALNPCLHPQFVVYGASGLESTNAAATFSELLRGKQTLE